MNSLEAKIANVEADIADTKEEIKQAKADGRSEEYLMKLMDYLKELQKEKNMLLEKSRGIGEALLTFFLFHSIFLTYSSR